jgi:hypothetical protein
LKKEREMPAEPSGPPNPPADRGMTEEEKQDLFDQMKEFEGPQRREIRGDDSEPPKDPGIAHS